MTDSDFVLVGLVERGCRQGLAMHWDVPSHWDKYG